MMRKQDFGFSRLVLTVLITSAIASAGAAEDGLVGHWKLAGDAKDSSGHGNHGKIHGADLTAAGPDNRANTAAKFDGKKAHIEIPTSDSLNLGKGDFTLSVWAHTEEILDDAIGDLLSKFDSNQRRGLNWCIKNSPGTSGSQSNYRNVHFGIDSGTEPKWTDCGRPGNAVYIMALAAHDGQLFAGTCEPGEKDTGHVYRFEGGTRWIDCGSPDRCNAVTTLAIHKGKLYAGTGHYHLAGSALPPSLNTTFGGKVFRYEEDGRWTDCGRLGECEAIGGLVTYRGELYGQFMYRPSGMYRYQGGQEWSRCIVPEDGRRVASPTVFNGDMYAVTFDGNAVYRFDGEKWSAPMVLEPRGQAYSLEVHIGQIFCSTWPNGRVYRSTDGKQWVDSGRHGSEREVMGMAVHNGKLYGGTLPLAEVYRYDGDDNWVNTGRLDHTPDVKYRRAWSMAVYDGKLYCGTLPAGHVHSLDAGANVTNDRELKAGWRHLAAIRQGDQLMLYVDGKLAATSKAAKASSLDVNNTQPLKIGFGGHDYFNGRLSDVRVYKRALAATEIANLAKSSTAR